MDKIGDRQNLFHRSGKLRQLCTGAFRLLRGVVGEFEHITCTQRQFINRSRQLAGRLRHRLNVLASIDDGLHRGAGFRQHVFGHFGHGFGVVANCCDRFDELSGDLLDRPLELRRERGHFLAPFLRPLLLGFPARELHSLNLENVVPENLDSHDHPPDFIGAIRVIQADRGVAGRQPLHGIGDRCDRLDDRSGNESHGGDTNQKPSESISRRVASDSRESGVRSSLWSPIIDRR